MTVHSTRTIRLFPILIILVYGFKIVGLAPFSLQRVEMPVSRNSRNRCCMIVFSFSKIGTVYNILLSITVQIVGGFAVPQLYSIKYVNKTPITEAIDVMLGILRVSTACFIILGWILRQRNVVSIMNRLLEVDFLLSGVEKHRPSEWKSFISFTVHIIIYVITWIVFWVAGKISTASILNWFIFHVPRFIVHWFVMQYFIVLEVLVRKLKHLNRNLLNFKELSNYLCCTPLPNHHNLPVLNRPTYYSQLAALELLHSIRTTLSEVSQDVADFFSFPILPTIACSFVTIVYTSYYFVTPVIVPNSNLSMLTFLKNGAWISVCAFVLVVYPIILLSYNVGKTLKEAKQTGLAVHKLLATAKRQDIQAELERFSLHLMHEKLSFTAYGFFTLDFTMIQSIFGVTATYLVIIIQFMQSAATAPNKTPR